MAKFAAFELPLDGTAERLHQLSKLAEGAGETVRRVSIDQALHDDVRWAQPVLRRRREGAPADRE